MRRGTARSGPATLTPDPLTVTDRHCTTEPPGDRALELPGWGAATVAPAAASVAPAAADRRSVPGPAGSAGCRRASGLQTAPRSPTVISPTGVRPSPPARRARSLRVAIACFVHFTRSVQRFRRGDTVPARTGRNRSPTTGVDDPYRSRLQPRCPSRRRSAANSAVPGQLHPVPGAGPRGGARGREDPPSGRRLSPDRARCRSQPSVTRTCPKHFACPANPGVGRHRTTDDHVTIRRCPCA